MPSGIYNSTVTWYQWLGTKDATYGQIEASYRNRGTLFCNIKEMAGQRGNEFNAVEYQTTSLIKVHGIIEIGGQDVLEDNYENRWSLDGVYHDRVANETVVTCHRFESEGII